MQATRLFGVGLSGVGMDNEYLLSVERDGLIDFLLLLGDSAIAADSAGATWHPNGAAGVSYGGVVTGNDDAHNELLRKFEAAIAGPELDDLRTLAGDLMMVADEVAGRTIRPDLRRPVPAEPRVLRIRVDLDEADPPIWRTLELMSDLTLDAVHQVLQLAFGWSDSHLHRFSLGGHPFAPASQLFLCPFDVEESEDHGMPAGDVRLDEVLQEPGDVLHYAYDYGDAWELTLRVEAVSPATAESPAATVVDGRRAAPPEDSGGATDLAALSLVLEDPGHFDLDELNEALLTPYLLLQEHGLDARLVDLAHRLMHADLGPVLAARAAAAVTEPTTPDPDDLATALRAHRWFLDRAVDGGIPLTSAGYLKPADVEAAAAVVPTAQDWYGKLNREGNVRPLLDFRETMQTMGLLRKHKGFLVLTKAGAAAQQDLHRLWGHLAGRLVPDRPGDFETAATLLVLAYAGGSSDGAVPVDEIAELLSELGWQVADGRPVQGHHLYRLRALDLLRNIGPPASAGLSELRVSPAAAAMARAALRSTD